MYVGCGIQMGAEADATVLSGPRRTTNITVGDFRDSGAPFAAPDRSQVAAVKFTLGASRGKESRNSAFGMDNIS